jgi:hypothetical protein
MAIFPRRKKRTMRKTTKSNSIFETPGIFFSTWRHVIL